MVITPMQLYLIRHGTDVSEFAERFADERLTTEGEDQAQKLARLMQRNNITRIYSSPSLPAKQTADTISEMTGISVIVDNHLSARDLGEANGMSYKQVRKSFPLVLQESQFGINWKFPGGESNGDVFNRCTAFARKMIETSSGKMERIAIVSHTLVLNYLIYGFHGLGFQDGLFYVLQGGSFAMLERSHGSFQLRYLGNV